MACVVLLKTEYDSHPAGTALRVAGGLAGNLIWKQIAEPRADLEDDASVKIIDYPPPGVTAKSVGGAPENKAADAAADAPKGRRKWLRR